MSENRTTIQDDMKGFLHRHPKMEMSLALDSNHVIVDIEDWNIARKQANSVQIKTEPASHIQNASYQRELLIDFCKHRGIQNLVPTIAENIEQLVDDYLET